MMVMTTINDGTGLDEMLTGLDVETQAGQTDRQTGWKGRRRRRPVVQQLSAAADTWIKKSKRARVRLCLRSSEIYQVQDGLGLVTS